MSPLERLTASVDEDRPLVLRAVGGGADGRRAFEILVERHQARVVRLLSYILGSRAEAEEVAQDVFLCAYTGLSAFRGDSSFRTWLRVIATRLAYNHSRSTAARTRREDAVGATLGSMPGADVATREALAKTLAALSYPYREALLLRHLEELSLEEIAHTLDISISAAKMRLSRARAAFFQHYQESVR